MARKQSKAERDRVRLHRQVAPGIPTLPQYESIEGQRYFDFDGSLQMRDEKTRGGNNLVPSWSRGGSQ